MFGARLVRAPLDESQMAVLGYMLEHPYTAGNQQVINTSTIIRLQRLVVVEEMV
jgi:hypothetical protein